MTGSRFFLSSSDTAIRRYKLGSNPATTERMFWCMKWKKGFIDGIVNLCGWCSLLGTKIDSPFHHSFDTPGYTKGGSIVVPVTSCLACLESALWLLTIFVFICKKDQSKPNRRSLVQGYSPFEYSMDAPFAQRNVIEHSTPGCQPMDFLLNRE